MSAGDQDKDKDEKTQFTPNPSELDGVCDLSQLIYLEMPNVLHNLKHRYCQMKVKYCYTSISSILLAINPYQRLPIYGNDVISQFQRAAETNRLITDRPHPYGVSARSYMRLVQRKKNQSVIVCGESGAGKTETTKKLLKYLAVTAPSSTVDSKTIEDQIVAASPILESYGNAKTVMNNNSSRFGKFTKLLYSVPENERTGSILGSYMETYLLEKSRVVFQAANERNYHIFYFLHVAFQNNSSKMKELCLETTDKFHYINQGKVSESFRDEENFEELVESLEKFRINKDEQNVLWKVTCGILNMGNITFKKMDSGYCTVDIGKCSKYVNNVAQLWDIDSKALIKRLETASVVINKKTIAKQIKFEDAHSNRDSIAKGIYENVFLWLCERINEELFLDEAKGEEGRRPDLKFIGILDVFGFENFWDNSMEQFCINYTNEKLQQFFNFHIIMSEQEEYLKESVMWKPLKIPDNKAYLELVEEKKSGFFTLLDSQCRGPAKDDSEALLQNLTKKHGDNPTFKLATKQGAGNWRGQKKKTKKKKGRGGARFSGFIIEHFADDVCYNIAEFLKKNAESVHSDTFKMIKKSSLMILQQIKQAKSRKKRSVTSVFHKGIKTLMKSLSKTEPYFVRCINPNKQKSSTVWTESIVEHQLRCGGLLEALKVLKLGYPTRVPYRTLYEKYHSNVNNPLIKNMNESAFSTSLLIAFDVNENDYELGLTKIFFKPAKAAILDTIMSKAGEPLTNEQNQKITRYIVGKRIRQLVGSIKTFCKFRRDVRKARAVVAWKFAGRIVSVLGATVHRQLFVARKRIKERNELNAAHQMQNMFRGYIERISYVSNIAKCKESVHIIWKAYQHKCQKQSLEQFFREALAERARIKAEELAKLKKLEEDEAEHKKQDEAAAIAAKEAADLLQAAADAKKKQMVIKISGPTSKEEKLENERNLQEQIENKRIKQERTTMMLRLKRTQTKLALQQTVSEQRDQEYRDSWNRRRTADVNMQKSINQSREDEKDMLDSSSSDLSSDDEKDDESESSDEDFDITELLDNFEQIARLGAKFSRHAGKRIHKKPQLRTVKVSFDDQTGQPMTLSWGAGSRAIKMKDIWYISWGHYTPIFLARKNNLEAMKCFSIVGHSEKQVLDLEAYTKRDAKIWVKGLRKLIKQTDKKADELAEMNMQRLLQYAAKQDEAKKQLKQKQLRVVKLQQDLFVMTVEAVYKELEEQKIWIINEDVKRQFDAASMYENVLTQDITWRKWQWFVREQITNYLRENDMVIVKPTAGGGTDDQKVENEDEVTVFLKHYKLSKYNGALRDAGLENLGDLKSLEDESIVDITEEVSMQTLHVNKFVQACNELKSGKYPPKHIKESNQVDQWLEYYNLRKYAGVLKKNGLNRLEDINALNENEIDTLAIDCQMKVLHKKKFIAACQEFKEKYKSHSNSVKSMSDESMFGRGSSSKEPGHKKKESCLMM